MRKLRDLFTGPKKWTQRTPAKDVDGEFCSAHGFTATCWCLTGAIVKLGMPYHDTCKLIAEFIDPSYLANPRYTNLSDKTKAERTVIQWNDAALREFDDIVDMVTTLDI